MAWSTYDDWKAGVDLDDRSEEPDPAAEKTRKLLRKRYRRRASERAWQDAKRKMRDEGSPC